MDNLDPNDYYCKIPWLLPKLDLASIQGLLNYQAPDFFIYEINDQDYLEDCIQNSNIRFHIPPSWINYTEITGYGSIPHTDPGSCCSLNYYITADNSVTEFHKLKPQSSARNSDQYYGYVDLDLMHRISINTNESYLLNVARIHSVRKHDVLSIRRILRLMWSNHDFLQVLNSIEIVK